MTTKTVLFLTATITPPPGATNLARTNPTIRMQDYKKALDFYISHLETTFDYILFVDNSASDLTELKDFVIERNAQSKVELMSSFGLDYAPICGRGYGELRLIDHAMANSQLLTTYPNARIWKCTGRYIVRNIRDLVASTPENADLYCHFRNWPLRLCELSVMSWTAKGFQTYVSNSAEHVRNDAVPGVHTFEEVLFRKRLEQLEDPRVPIQRRFRRTPIIEGNRGWDNSNYSKRFSPKIIFRQVCSVFAPWLWV